MTQQEILDYNKLCAEFLFPNAIEEYNSGDISLEDGIFKKGMLIFGHFDMMKYHSDWNWIHEVIEAIEKELDGSRPFKYGKLDDLDFNISNKLVKINASFWTNPNTVNGNYWSYFKFNKKINKNTKKEVVVQAINQFLIWYKENKK